MRMPRTRTLLATAAMAAATATAGFVIASTAGASTTTTAGTLTAATGNTGTSLSITASQGAIAAGQRDTISGSLLAGGSPAAHRVVVLERYNDKRQAVAAHQDQADQQVWRGHLYRASGHDP